jgi:hypothetical protein
MIDRPLFPYKSIALYLLLGLLGLVAAYIAFLGGISVWIGLSRLWHDGFWMPILVGIVLIISMLWLFLRFSRFVLNRLKVKTPINI